METGNLTNGALIRRDAAGGSYVEGSLRAGRSRTELSGGDLKNYIGQTAGIKRQRSA